MVSIKTVAVLGGTGNLGPAVIRELVASGFAVTAVTRAEGGAGAREVPAGVAAVKSVDYGSLDDLTAAFQGQDAVVSTVATAAVGGQRLAVDAAVAAGVKRFIPSEFGINTRKVRDTPIGKILAGKIAIVDYLEQVAAKGSGLTWTGVSTGLFFEWGLERGGLGIVNLKDKTATVIDSGDEKWYASTLAQIGRVVAGILKSPDETANKYLSTASFNLSQNELIALVEELTGSKLSVTKVSSADLIRAGEEKLTAGNFGAFLDLLRAHNNADGAGNGLPEEQSDNGLVGVPYEEVRASVEEWLRREGVL
ncbi:hypothetical protein MYCTH_2308372 [Thermothelomyces thermophilus ATCC 42464]|uniref:NmrA-like domain-containing protein n=1 Tax=Thermothelomyces thermophilus (strain ATCC 42464 / BCRC 31852 / DSM 1799) TaxID=573729 RepID=G2QJR1_THET4|nr:uncharacterized protein MYCTH_2308372 [Thermothelomyces thermophilus ATCC 42464]AEO59818.1 hypothetical protein MYCTH_2308372 [Thermothelomyces thermophilus ATCC 42464]